MRLSSYQKILQTVPSFVRVATKNPKALLLNLYHSTVRNELRDRIGSEFGLGDGFPVLDLLDLFPDFNETVDPYTHLMGTSFPIDIALLKSLARRFKDCEYLEIGSWRGESIANVATVAKHCVSLSLSESEMYELGFGEKFVQVQRMFSRGIEGVEHVEANSLTFDFSKLGRKFDLIFVDGDHSYEACKKDTENAFSLLKDEKSIIVWHDYAMHYEDINWNVFAGIVEGAPRDRLRQIYQVSNTLCAAYIPENFQTTKLEFPSYPNKSFSVAIRGEKMKK